MGVDRGVARGAREVLVLAVRDMLVRLRVAVLLRQPEVDAVDKVGLAREADQEVVRFDVTVKYPSSMKMCENFCSLLKLL